MYSQNAIIRRTLLVVAVALWAMPSLAQQWEVGGSAGGSFYIDQAVAAGAASGTVGFRPGFAVGGWIGHKAEGRLGGEVRYLFQRNDVKLASGGTTYAFSSQSHLIHYDLLIHMNQREDRVRPFVAIGGGMKGYIGTGAERAVQPLNNLALLSATRQWQPMLSLGGGVSWTVGSRIVLRAEVRDYVTPVPKNVILPAPGASISGWVHDIVPMFGVSYIIQ